MRLLQEERLPQLPEKLAYCQQDRPQGNLQGLLGRHEKAQGLQERVKLFPATPARDKNKLALALRQQQSRSCS